MHDNTLLMRPLQHVCRESPVFITAFLKLNRLAYASNIALDANVACLSKAIATMQAVGKMKVICCNNRQKCT